MTPDEMIDALLRNGPEAADGKIANDLLSEFWRGYPIENLRRLFVPPARGDAAFLVSELGEKARPLISEIAELVSDERPRIRGDAIRALSMCTTWEDGWAVGKIVMALGDPHDGVRRTATDALRYMESETLQAGFEYLHENLPNSAYARFKSAFLMLERRPEQAAVTLQRLLTADDAITRSFGAAMAVRPRRFIDAPFVALAEASSDPEIRKIAREAKEHSLPPWAIWTDSRLTKSD
ncbi:MAG: hypothetical protein H7124_00100 [Phycisphaerales bacterium]|nr:hypothetical protein [Hyphomonadaceae bacterium]